MFPFMNGLMKERTVEVRQVTNTPVMEVKMFANNDVKMAQEELNEWLSEQTIHVQHIGQSQCERNGKLMLVTSIFYFNK
jgi:hypothetical protein